MILFVNKLEMCSNLEDQIWAECSIDVSDCRSSIFVLLIRELGLVSGSALHLHLESLFDQRLHPSRRQSHSTLILQSLFRDANHQVLIEHTWGCKSHKVKSGRRAALACMNRSFLENKDISDPFYNLSCKKNQHQLWYKTGGLLCVYLFLQQRRRACVHSRDCVDRNSVRLHISLHTRHGDLPAMETLLAGDWLWSSTHREACTPTLTRSEFKIKKALSISQTFHKHSCVQRTTLTPKTNVCKHNPTDDSKTSHVTFNWPLTCSHVLAAAPQLRELHYQLSLFRKDL